MTNGGSARKPSGWQGLSEASKVALIAAGITCVGAIVAAFIGPLLSHDSSSSNPPPSVTSSAPVSPGPSASGTSGGSDSPTPSPTGSTSPGGAYPAAYHDKPLTIQTTSNGACGYGELVNIDKPNVDPQTTTGDSFDLSSLDCTNWGFQVQLSNNASGNKPVPSAQLTDSPAACLDAIASDPNPQDDPAKVGDAFCVNSGDGFLAYVKITGVDAQGDVTVQLNAWSTSQ